ncbi:MAG: helix-turn-helix transcriptional regulator [Acidobacteriaceae bacterium]
MSPRKANTGSAGISPLTPAVFHILLALSDGRKHGYAILKQVNADGGHSLRMGPGTLYGSLQRMEASGLVQEFDDASDERRRFYELTGSGQRALSHELRRLREVLTAAARKGLASSNLIRASGKFR